MKRFIKCLLPITKCNLKCEYCYVIQNNYRREQDAPMPYSAEQIGLACSAERFGGVCFFSICGSGETMMAKELPDIVYNLLKQGHYINITTNGTITKSFESFTAFPALYLKRIHFSFSLHYLELLRIKKLDSFFNNIRLVKSLGCSFFIQLNLYDEYITYLDEIRKICFEETNQLPQLILTRRERNDVISVHTNLPLEEYINAGKTFDSPYFDFSIENFEKKQNDFCYAGDWSACLNLSTGMLKQCYSGSPIGNIFDDLGKINFTAIGKNCGSPYCVNASHFLALGCIPSLIMPSYAALRDRGGYTDSMKMFLSQKLSR